MRLLALPLAILALTACDPQPEGEPVMRTEIGSGEAEARATPTPTPTAPQRASACRAVEFETTLITHCIADPAKHAITTALGPSGGAPYRSLANLAGGRPADAPTVAFAFNGGMYDKDGQPIGYYVERGERLEELNRADGSGNFHLKPNGVFYGTGTSWHVRTADSFYANVSDRPDFGTQSGPMLVIDGKLHPEFSEDGPSKAIRNGVGVDAQGRAHFAISEEPLSFGRFARFFRDEAKTPNALYLDGNVSALWDPAKGRLDTGPSIGPMIVVEDRE